jgi:Rrf2 family protein
MAGSANTQFAVAVHVVTMLADAGDEPLSSEYMAASVQTTSAHVRRVLGHLRRAGIVISRPGAKGGWHVTGSPDAVRLGDIWRAVHSNAPVLALHGDTSVACPVGRNITTTLGTVRTRVVDAMEAELDSITVADVLRDTLGANR